MSAFVVLLALLQVGPSASTLIERIQAKTPVEDVSSLDVAHIAGVYKNPGTSLIKEIGGALSGDVLYLLPDGTYIFTEWSDISPEAISDKGAWTFSHGLAELASDTDVKWKPGIDRRLIAVRRPAKRDEILLFEVGRLPDFEVNAGKDPESMLLIVAKERYKRLRASETPKLKSSLMRNLWNPRVH